MGKLIKISKEVAESIGIVKFRKNNYDCEFNPFCSEQKDGSFLVDEDALSWAKELEEVKLVLDKVDFTKMAVITEKEIDLKEGKQ